VDKHIKPADYRSERIDSVSGSIWSNIIAIFISNRHRPAAIGGRPEHCNRRNRPPRL